MEGTRISLDERKADESGSASTGSLRIAIYVHCFYPLHFHGTEAYARALAGAMRMLGHHPTIVTTTPPGDPPQASPIERFELDGIPVIRIDRTGLSSRPPALMPIQSEIFREIDPDVVHVAHLKNHSTAVLTLADERGIPVFATLTDAFGICPRTTLETADGEACTGPNASRSNCIACALAPRIRRESRAHRLLAPARLRRLLAGVAVAGHGLLPRRLRRSTTKIVERPDAMRAAYASYRAAFVPTRWLAQSYRENGFGFPVLFSPFGTDVDRRPKPARNDGPLRLGFVGQIAAHKGLHLVVEALKGLDARAYTLDAWGSETQDPDYAARVRASASGLPIAFRGTFEPEDMAAVLAGIDLLILPSTWRENSPLTLIAALATHTPVVVSDVAGMTDLVEEGRNGVSFRRGDAQDLARILKTFLDEPGRAPRLGGQTSYERTDMDVARDILAVYAEHGIGPRERRR